MFKVMQEQCSQCLFSKDKIVSNARRKQILTECKRDDSHFICHKTKDACCRGFFNTFSTNLIRIAGRLKAIEYVSVETEKLETPNDR